MKVLVVLTQPPLPEGGAPGKCAIGLLRGLAAHGVDVRAVAARQVFAHPGEPPADLPVEVVDVPAEPTGWRARYQRLRRPRGDLARGELAERVRDAAREADVVHLEETETAWADEGLDGPSLVHMHYLVRRDRSLGAPWSRAARDTLELELAERAAIRRHRFLVASSPLVEAELRARRPDGDIVRAPLSLDPNLYEPASLEGPPVAGIIGTGTWPPTRAALERLVERVWPRIVAAVPEARLLVAGRGLGFLERRALPDGVELVGEVASSHAFLGRLSTLVFPLDRGSGMKVKTLEAMACGVPVVTTTAGAEGIERNSGVVVAEDDSALAAATVALLRDSGERRERGTAARKTFDRFYAPAPATRPLVELYERMV